MLLGVMVQAEAMEAAMEAAIRAKGSKIFARWGIMSHILRET